MGDMDIVQMLLKDQVPVPKRPLREGDEMSDTLWSLVDRCLQSKNPSLRPKAHEIADAGIISMI